MATAIESLTINPNLTLDKLYSQVKMSKDKQGEKLLFEKTLNEMLVKELLTPILNGALGADGNEYSALLQDSLTGYLANNMNFINSEQAVKGAK